jgi:hypothetical protein
MPQRARCSSRWCRRALSVSVLCCDDARDCSPASAARQVYRIPDPVRRCKRQCAPDPHGRYAQLARDVVGALPGLWGYVVGLSTRRKARSSWRSILACDFLCRFAEALGLTQPSWCSIFRTRSMDGDVSPATL